MADDNLTTPKDYSPKDVNNSIYNYVKWGKILNDAVNNYQKIFGIKVDVYRIEERELNRYVKVYGPSQVSLKQPSKFKFVKSLYLLNAPTELYYKYHDNSNEMDVKLGTNELKVGDMIKIPWVDGNTLDYFVAELPRTIGDMYFVYRVVSNFNVNTGNKG